MRLRRQGQVRRANQTESGFLFSLWHWVGKHFRTHVKAMGETPGSDEALALVYICPCMASQLEWLWPSQLQSGSLSQLE